MNSYEEENDKENLIENEKLEGTIQEEYEEEKKGICNKDNIALLFGILLSILLISIIVAAIVIIYVSSHPFGRIKLSYDNLKVHLDQFEEIAKNNSG
jgi:hypothetical protein